MKYSVVILEDNEDMSAIISKVLIKSNFFDVLGVASDGEVGLKMIVELNPQIVLIDIILPKKDGINILESMSQMYKKDKVTKIMITAVSRQKTIEYALKLGADYFILKPFDATKLPMRIKEIHEGKSDEMVKINEQQFKIDISEFEHLLTCIGISKKFKGYKYIAYGTYVCLKENIQIDILKDEIYPKIAKEFKTNSNCVARNIRFAISQSWTPENIENYKKYINYETSQDKKPTISELFRHIVAKYK